MRSAIAVFCLCLTGCAIFNAPVPTLERTRSVIDISIVDDDKLPANIGGKAWWVGESCVVWIKESMYPNCITHEVLHCLAGSWHGDMPSAEWCAQ